MKKLTLSVIATLLLISGLSAQNLKVHTSQGNETIDIEEIDSITFSKEAAAKPNVAVLWTSGDPDVAEKMVFMYLSAAKSNNWLGKIRLIVWGPSSKLLSENTILQNKVKNMLGQGITIEACKACADSYGVSSKLSSLGITVKYMGSPLSQFIADPQWQVLTF